MMNDAAWQLQIALVALLNNDNNILNLLGNNNVYDEVPRRHSLPYIVVEVYRGEDWSTSTEEGASYVIQLRIWSDYLGRRQVLEIGEAAESAILSANINLAGYHLINLRVQNAQLGRDQDGRTYVNVLQFRAVTEPI